MTNHQSGIDAEKLAVDYLTGLGYEINSTRYKTKNGEVDIIASLKNSIAFIEVKKRKAFGFDDPITPTKKNG